jgi:hypothetical protein
MKNIPPPPPPRSWAQALAHPGIETINDYRRVFPDAEDMQIQVILADGWSLAGDLIAFYVSDLADLRDQWGDIENTS